MPSAAELELGSPLTQAQIRRIVRSFDAACVYDPRFEISLELLRDLWPSILLWIRFFFDWDFLAWVKHELKVTSKQQILATFIEFTLQTEEHWTRLHPDVTAESGLGLRATPGFMDLLVRSWIVAMIGPTGGPVLVADIQFLRDCMSLFPTIISPLLRHELFEVIPGGFREFARLCTSHCAALRLAFAQCPTLRVTEYNHYLQALAGLCSLFQRIHSSFVSEEPQNRDFVASLRRGFAVELIEATVTILDPRANKAHAQMLEEDTLLLRGTLGEVLSLLSLMLDVGPHAVSRAAEKFLFVVVHCAAYHLSHEKIKYNVARVLEHHLPRWTSFPLLLQRLTTAVQAIFNHTALVQHLESSALYPAWTSLIVILQQADAVLFSIQTKNDPARGVCDNISCGRMDIKSQLKRCSGCNVRIYCSAKCQKTDWKTGKHRKICGLAARVQLSLRRHFSKRDINFFRHFLSMLYIQHAGNVHCKIAVCFQSASDPQAHDPRQASIVLFDFRRGFQSQNDITAHSESDLAFRTRMLRDDPTFDDWVERAKRSNGRLQLHVMAVPVGENERWIIFPFHVNMSFMQDAAVRLGSSVREAHTAGGFRRLLSRFEAMHVPPQIEYIHQ
uniref:MYND-type domain-containing protein n=1 Tax=Mycena chlorophos TaxID=658473 RepID=A0ABQ0LNF3_MYCCL|nr:predicted protein [Mycena chlorophos]